MRLEGKVCGRRTQTPDLDCPVQTSGCEGVGIFWIDRETHDIMTVSFKDLHTLPLSVPIPQLDGHVVRGSEYERLCGMYDDSSDIVWMCFERGDLLGGVVVVDSELKVI